MPHNKSPDAAPGNIGAFSRDVTELGIVYRNQPEQGVRKANRMGGNLDGFLRGFSKVVGLFYVRFIGYWAKIGGVINPSYL
jgi:hypothetical protein